MISYFGIIILFTVMVYLLWDMARRRSEIQQRCQRFESVVQQKEDLRPLASDTLESLKKAQNSLTDLSENCDDEVRQEIALAGLQLQKVEDFLQMVDTDTEKSDDG